MRCYNQFTAAKSAVRRENRDNTKATVDAIASFFYVVMSAYQYLAAQIRAESMVALAGQPKGWPGSFVSGILTPVNVTTNLERENSGGDSLHTKETAIMATTPTQNPSFIWLIAAVRRDRPVITATIHHIAANSEQEARRTLAREHVCFFAGRLPVQEVRHA